MSFLYYIRRLMEQTLSKMGKEDKSVSLNQDKLIEMSRINMKEFGNVPFPTNKFEIKIWSNDHNPPHFHVIYEGWNISFTIEDGKELEVNSVGTHSSDYNYIVKNVPIWLDMRCKIAPEMTNKRNAIVQWQQLHETEI